MDNLTHTLVGLAAAKAGLERASPYATAVCLVAANAPDSDIVALAGGRWFYLQHHRGITHSVVGTLALALLVPLLFYAGERIVARARGFTPRARLGGLTVASLVVSATHPLMDWTNNYGLRPFLPWSGKWYYGDLVFIVDPWLWLALGGACFLATARRGWRVYAWARLAALLTYGVVFVAPARAGLAGLSFLTVAWLACVVAFAAAYWLRLGERWGRATPAAALAFVLLYWGALWIAHARALDLAARQARESARLSGETLRSVAVMPALADPTRWIVVSETDRSFSRFQLSLRAEGSHAPPASAERFEKPSGEPARWLARAAEEDYGVRVFLGFARFPAARVEGDCPGGARLQLADLRFTQPGAARPSGSFALEIPARCGP